MLTTKVRIVVAVGATALATCAVAAPAQANNAPNCPSYAISVPMNTSYALTPQCTDSDGPAPLSYSLVKSPEFGTISASNANGNATYIPYTGFAGTDSFQYRASDGAAQSVVATVTITVTGTMTNQAPSCPDASAFVVEGGSVDLFGNCVDPENDQIFYNLTAPYPHGNLQILSGSSVRYSPSRPAPDTDSFGYTAKDRLHPAQTVVVQVDVLPAATTTFPPSPEEATPTEPLQASVITPTAPSSGVNIDRRPTTTTPPLGFFLLGEEFDITAPAASAANPLKLVFTIDGSVDIGGLVILRNEDPVASTCDPGTAASPDPCVESIDSSSGDHVITVRTSHASVWSMAVPEHVVSFEGFSPPVDDRPAVNSAKAGNTVPVKFTLGEDEGDSPFADGFPKAQAVACDSGESTSGASSIGSPGSSGLTHDGATYQVNWKTERSWAGTCRQLVLRFDDSAGTTVRAAFEFR
jgi:hypothetical protein